MFGVVDAVFTLGILAEIVEAIPLIRYNNVPSGRRIEATRSQEGDIAGTISGYRITSPPKRLPGMRYTLRINMYSK